MEKIKDGANRKEGRKEMIFMKQKTKTFHFCAPNFFMYYCSFYMHKGKKKGLINGVIIEGLNIKTTASLLLH